MSDSEVISDEEAFRNDYLYFEQSVDVLAAPAVEQCERMGDYNIAWELKDDTSAGRYLVGRGYLSPSQEAWVAALLGALSAVDAQALPAGAGREANLAAMQHPSWEPLRLLARETLRQLEPFTALNNRYFKSGST